MKTVLVAVFALSSFLFVGSAEAEKLNCGSKDWHVKGPSIRVSSIAECSEIEKNAEGVNPWHHKKSSYVVGGGKPAAIVNFSDEVEPGIWLAHQTATTRIRRVKSAPQ